MLLTELLLRSYESWSNKNAVSCLAITQLYYTLIMSLFGRMSHPVSIRSPSQYSSHKRPWIDPPFYEAVCRKFHVVVSLLIRPFWIHWPLNRIQHDMGEYKKDLKSKDWTLTCSKRSLIHTSHKTYKIVCRYRFRVEQGRWEWVKIKIWALSFKTIPQRHDPISWSCSLHSPNGWFNLISTWLNPQI